jgi:Spx/MgsR family transcriptional regulator
MATGWSCSQCASQSFRVWNECVIADRIVAQAAAPASLDSLNGIIARMNTTATPSSTVIAYGIPNCDTVKKARTWLTSHAVDHGFHDFKKQGVPAELLPGWLAAVGWETLVNRKGTTWRKLDEDARLAVVDAASAMALMRAQPSVIKRPVVVWGDGAVTVGFSAEAFAGRVRR